MALMSKNHPLSNCKYITLEKLEKYLLVFFNNSGTYVLDVINHELKDKNIKLHISRVADERLLYKYLLEENAISFTIEQASGSYPESLKCIAMDERFVQKAAALVPKGRLDDNIKTYINIIKTLINSY